MSKLQDKPSALRREHPALQKMKFINFFYVCGSFLSSWIRIQSGSGPTALTVSLYKLATPQVRRTKTTCLFSVSSFLFGSPSRIGVKRARTYILCAINMINMEYIFSHICRSIQVLCGHDTQVFIFLYRAGAQSEQCTYVSQPDWQLAHL
jgi:hypothetical protein